MAVPSGYTPLAKVGMVNKGTYSASATYNNLDFVYYNGSSYVAKKDGLTGVTPAEGANWQYLAKGFLNADATGINIKDTSNLMGSGAGKAVTLQTWGDKVANWLVSKVITNDNFVTKLTERLVNNGTTTSTGFALDARYGKTLQDAVNTLNSSRWGAFDDQDGNRSVISKEYDLSYVKYIQLLFNPENKMDIAYMDKNQTWHQLLSNLELLVEERSVLMGDINAKELFFPQIETAKSDYRPIGILGATTSGGDNWTKCAILDAKIDGTAIWSRGYNFSNSKAIGITAKFKILYQSNLAVSF